MSKKKTLKLKPDSQAASPGKVKVARRHQKNNISKKAKLNSPAKSASSPVQVKKSASTPKKAEQSDKPVRVYADGVFDMYHIGHARVLEQAKNLFPNVHLIVGVSGDQETIEKKGRIVMSQEERCDILRHCRWVDEIICPCPWVITLDFIEKNNIDYVAHDDAPYDSAGADDIYAEIKKAGKFKATKRTEGISTSDIILRIIQDYDMYVSRSMQRGYNRKEIGLSWSKFQRMKWFNKLKKYAQKYENNIKGFQSEIENSPMYKRIKSHFRQLLGVEDQKSLAQQTDEEESDFDA